MAHFYTLDIHLHALKQLALPQGQAWWQGLEDAQDGLLYLHGYGDRKLGQHMGIIAIAAESGDIIWEKAELAFYGFSAGGMLAYHAAAPETDFQLLQPDTGVPLKTGITQQQAAEAVALYSKSRHREAAYPVLYLEGEAYFAQVVDFLEETQPVQAIEYAETNSAVVVSYYERDADDTLINYIAVYNLEGVLQLKEKLADGLSGIGSDTFFIFMDELYFIRNKAILEVYRLLD